jgi:uncharacterized protein (DUF58 family)
VTQHRARARAGVAGAQFLDPAVLARIDNLELLARTVVDGFVAGLHRSPFMGLSLDFAEHRAYMPGDDIRNVDWRLFARTDRYYVKLYEAETNASFAVLLDVSSSMSYGSDRSSVTKLDYARFLAACLAYFSRQQRDRVGLVTFDEEIVDYVPPSVRNLDLLLHRLDRVDAGRPGELRGPLLRCAEIFERRGILALLSDLYHEPDEVVRAVRLLRGRGHEVMVFHVLDPAELEFPFESPSSFEHMESGERVPLVPRKLREQYRTMIRAHVEELERRFKAERVDYILLDSSKPLDHALFRYLVLREKRSRVR